MFPKSAPDTIRGVLPKNYFCCQTTALRKLAQHSSKGRMHVAPLVISYAHVTSAPAINLRGV